MEEVVLEPAKCFGRDITYFGDSVVNHIGTYLLSPNSFIDIVKK